MTTYRANYTGQDFRGNQLTNFDFSDAILVDAILSYENLAKKCFNDSDLTRCQLDSAELPGSTFRYTILKNADLKCANLRFATLEWIVGECADFSFANLEYTKLWAAKLTGAIFREACLECADITSADLSNADLSFANLKEADLTKSKLIGANLTNANLTLVDLSEADLTGAILTGVTGLGTKAEEIEFARNSLREIEAGDFQFDMNDWSHCIVGLAFPQDPDPEEGEALASRLYPTLAKYFCADTDTALDALRKVAVGKLSVFG